MRKETFSLFVHFVQIVGETETRWHKKQVDVPFMYLWQKKQSKKLKKYSF